MLETASETKRRDAEAIRFMVTRTFMDVLRQTNLAPLEVLEYAATAIGTMYRDVADAHTWPRECPCGWEPDMMADVAMLKSALSAAAIPELDSPLARAVVAGNA